MRLSHYAIDEERCRHCGLCARLCPHGALKRSDQGETATFAIDQKRCRRCGMCLRGCPAQAVRRPYRLTTLSAISRTGRGE